MSHTDEHKTRKISLNPDVIQNKGEKNGKNVKIIPAQLHFIILTWGFIAAAWLMVCCLFMCVCVGCVCVVRMFLTAKNCCVLLLLSYHIIFVQRHQRNKRNDINEIDKWLTSPVLLSCYKFFCFVPLTVVVRKELNHFMLMLVKGVWIMDEEEARFVKSNKDN